MEPKVLDNGVIELIDVDTHICLPGQPILLAVPGAILSLGRGIERRGQQSISGTTGEVLVASLCGVLRKDRGPMPGSPTTYYVQPSSQKRYVPRKGDPVVCTVLRVTANNYSVSIGAAHAASLGTTAFDGATKTNRPRLRIGDIVYGHVEQCDPGLTVDISCCAVGSVAPKDWSTGEALFGPLSGGTVISVPLGYAHDLFHNNVPVMSIIGQRVAYEACIGLNGRVWLRGCVPSSSAEGGSLSAEAAAATGGPSEQSVTIAVAECITESICDGADEAAVRSRVETYFPSN